MEEIYLNEYHFRCLDVFTHYDNLKALQNEYWKAEQVRHAPIRNFKAFVDSVKAKGQRDKYDSLRVSIQTDKCWCDSTADHQENKGVVPVMIVSCINKGLLLENKVDFDELYKHL